MRPSGSGRTVRRGWALGLGLVAAMALFAAVITYVSQRVLCRTAATVPFLNAGCGSDPLTLAAIVGAAVGGVALVLLLLSRLTRG